MKSDHIREADDLDYLLRDALWSSRDSAPDPARVLASLHTRIRAERRPTRVSWLLVMPSWSSSQMAASYWYLEPLARVLR